MKNYRVIGYLAGQEIFRQDVLATDSDSARSIALEGRNYSVTSVLVASTTTAPTPHNWN